MIRYATEGHKHTKSFAQIQVNAEAAISHLMKKCELKPSGKGTAATAFCYYIASYSYSYSCGSAALPRAAAVAAVVQRVSRRSQPLLG